MVKPVEYFKGFSYTPEDIKDFNFAQRGARVGQAALEALANLGILLFNMVRHQDTNKFFGQDLISSFNPMPGSNGAASDLPPSAPNDLTGSGNT